MRWVFVPLMLLFLCGTDDCNEAAKSVPPSSMRVVEYKEITGKLPGPTIHVWMVADDRRDLCFVVFNSGGSTLAVERVNCDGVKPTPERGCPFPKPFGMP